MPVPAPWQEVLSLPNRKSHIVQFYQDDDFLARGVAFYLHEGFLKNDQAVLILTPEHWEAIRERLEEMGTRTSDLKIQGRLLVLDARETLARFMRGGFPDRRLLESEVAERIRQASSQAWRDARIRAYGEMVDLLWQDGQPRAALELERFWNELIRDHPFTLLCAYKVDPWDPRLAERDSRAIFQEHSHLIPVEDIDRLNASVDRALEDVLGKVEMQALRPLILANKSRLPVMPGAQVAILWIQDNLPEALGPILHQARRHYQMEEATRPR